MRMEGKKLRKIKLGILTMGILILGVILSLKYGGAARMNQLFSRRQTRGTNVATFLALLELVRGGRVQLGPTGEMTMHRGHLSRKKEIK